MHNVSFECPWALNIFAGCHNKYCVFTLIVCRIWLILWWTAWKTHPNVLKMHLKSRGWFYITSWRYEFDRPSNGLQALFHFHILLCVQGDFQIGVVLDDKVHSSELVSLSEENPTYRYLTLYTTLYKEGHVKLDILISNDNHVQKVSTCACLSCLT